MSALHLTIQSNSVAVLTFDQPDSQVNALTPELWTEFEAVLDSLHTRSDLRGLVLASDKPNIFIAGADLNWLATVPGPNDPEVRAIIEHGLRVLKKLESLPCCTCAAIDGAALGGGLEVALACDYRFCGTGEKVRLGLPEVKLGLIPGWGGTQRLSRIVGMETAGKMLTSGANADAREALVSGLISQIVPSESLIDECAQFCLLPGYAQERERKQNPIPHHEVEEYPNTLPGGLGADQVAIRVMIAGAAQSLEAGLAIETAAFMRLAGSPESKQLIAEFFASRKK